MRIGKLVLVILALATAMHLDWHAARPTAHHLSLGLRWHWLLAVPAFALVAWYVLVAWPERRWSMAITIIAVAAVLGGFAEPAYEYWLEGATLEWAFGSLRNNAFITFTLTGLVTVVSVLLVRRSSTGAERLR